MSQSTERLMKQEQVKTNRQVSNVDEHTRQYKYEQMVEAIVYVLGSV